MPEGAILIKNPNGTAPSFIVEDSRGVIFSLPGVPVEMKWLFENEVEPYLRKKFNLAEVIHYRVLKIIGIGESAVDDKIGHLIANSSNPTVGVLALPGQVDVRIAAKAADREQAMKMIAPLEAEVRALLGNAIFAADDETMEHVVGRLLRGQSKNVAVYEDLTCGHLAERLQTASMEHFSAGFICNSEAARRALLKHAREPGRVGALIHDPVALTDELAWRRAQSPAAILGWRCTRSPIPTAKFKTWRAAALRLLTDGRKFVQRESANATRRLRPLAMMLNAIDPLRTALIEGMG
jgi:nicotinamide-nucleotide amidase